MQSFATEPASEDFRHLLEEQYSGRTLYPFVSGQSIPLGPQDVWIVCRGVVQVGTLYTSGDEALLGLICPAMPFGLPFTVIRPYQATALTNVDLMRLSLAEVEQSPALSQSIFHQLNRRLRQTEALLAMVGYRRVEERLRHLLLLLAQEVGQPQGDRSVRLSVRLTHQQLANTVGTTRVTVTRLLSQMKQADWLTLDRQRHIILTQAALKCFAES
ncbi:MAG: Crp/Fnr family transcriptional regulator [Cyanobacteria bacterium P01_A01_bin.135]